MKKLFLLFSFLIITSCGRDDSPTNPVEQTPAQDFTNPVYVTEKLQGKWILNWVNSNGGVTNYTNGDYREFLGPSIMNVRTKEGNVITITNWTYTVSGKTNLAEFPFINSHSENPPSDRAYQITTLTDTKLVLKGGTYIYSYTKN